MPARLIAVCALAFAAMFAGSAVSGAGTESTSGDWLQCGLGAAPSSLSSDPSVFAASALRGPGGAEDGNSPADVALRGFLAMRVPLPRPLPEHSYRLLRQTPTTALYGHLAPAGAIDQYIMLANQTGEWRYLNNGGCRLARVFAGRAATMFELNGQPKPTARTIQLTLQTDTCTARRPFTKQLQVIAKRETRRLVLTLLLRAPATPMPPPVSPLIPACAGRELAVPVKLLLPRALGQRKVFNGSLYPASPATVNPARPDHTLPVTVGIG